MMPLVIKIDGIISFEILNLDHWNLFDIWLLVLGISLIFAKQVIFVNSVTVYVKAQDT